MQKCKNIILVNFHSAKNAGDLALLEQSIRYLNQAFDSPKFTVLANWPEEDELKSLNVEILPSVWYLVGVGDKKKKPINQVLTFIKGFLFLFLWLIGGSKYSPIIHKSGWEKLFYTLKMADLVIAVPGNQMFSSSRKAWPLPTLVFPLWLAELLHRKVIIFPQSIGPFRTKLEQFIVGKVYNKANKCYIRDEISLALAKSMMIKVSEPEIVPDLAFTYEPGSIQEATALMMKNSWEKNQKNIGLTVIAPMPSYLDEQVMGRYYQALINAVNSLLVLGYNIYIFNQVTGPSVDENDYTVALNLFPYFDETYSHQVHLIKEQLPPQLLKSAYGLMDAFIASRLHSGIFSISMNTPTLFVGYLHKTKGVLQSLGLDNYFLDINSITDKDIISKIQIMIENRSTIKTRLREINNSIMNNLNSLPEKIRNIWQQT